MRRGLVAWTIVAVYAVVAAVGVAVRISIDAAPLHIVETFGFHVAFGLFAVLGAVLIVRRPGHVLGVLFAAVALPVAVGHAGDAVAGAVLLRGAQPSLPVRLLAWPNTWYWYGLLTVLLVYVPLLFPDGHLPSPRWRWLAWPVGVAVAVACGLAAVSERISMQTVGPDGRFLSVDNPVGITGVPPAEQNPVFMALLPVILVGLAGGVAAVFVRYRGSAGVERQQLKWFVTAVCVLGVGIVIGALPLSGFDIVGSIVFLAGVIGVPVSVTVAILRFRLYEIDRIISRTVTYALVTAVLFAVYTVVATLPGLLFGLESDLLVAAATLAVAAVFVPLRRGVQDAVDRRFNRTRYDAVRVVERFGSRLRDDLDLESLHVDLRRVVASTVQPSHVSLWLRRETAP